MPEIDPVVLRLQADLGKYGRDLDRVTRRVDEQLSQQGRAAMKLEKQISASTGAIATSFGAMASALAAGFSAQQVAQMADSYTRFTNQLKVAGLEGQALAQTQERLFGVAQKNGVEIEAVGTLYSRAAQNQKELGASTSELIGLTRAVAASLRISGTSTNEASGALLQLGQALGSPRIEAEEFNSLLDTMQPLLREASKYIDGTGNSLAGLTRLIKDQNGPGVSNVKLFEAINKAMAALEKTAASTTLTIGGAFTNLSNAITKYIGEADRANGATVVITTALNALATNLGSVTQAISVLAVYMVGRFAAGMVAGATATGAASTAMFALQARAAGAATTMEALALTSRAAGVSMLAAFGGPVGLAVTALTLGIGYLYTRTDEASKASGEYARQQQILTAIQGRATTAAEAVATATGKARAEALANAKALQQETQQYIISARAAAAAARAKAQAAVSDARTVANSGGAAVVGAGSAMIVGGNIVGQRTDRAARQAQANARQADQNLANAIKEEERLNGIIAGLRGAPTFTPPVAPADKPDKKTGRTGPSPEEIARRFQDDIEQGQLAIRQSQAEAQIVEASARANAARTIEERMAAEQEAAGIRRGIEADRIEFERLSNARAIAADEDLNKALKDQLLQLNDRVAAAQRETINAEALADSTEARAEEQQRLLDADRNSAQYEQMALDALGRIAVTRQERNEIERRILDSMEREEVAQLEAEISAGRIADAARARADLATAQAARRTYADQQGESPLDRRRREVRQTAANMGDVLEDIELDAVDRLTDGIADATTEFIKLGGVAGDVLNSILNDLIRLSVQRAIFGSGGAGSGGGLLGTIGGLFGGARAKGGPVTGGKTYLVGEQGPELFRASASGTIVPNNELVGAAARGMVGASVASPAAPMRAAPVLNFDLRGAVVTEDLLAQMNAMAQEAAQAGAQGGRILAAKDMAAMRRPGM